MLCQVCLNALQCNAGLAKWKEKLLSCLCTWTLLLWLANELQGNQILYWILETTKKLVVCFFTWAVHFHFLFEIFLHYILSFMTWENGGKWYNLWRNWIERIITEESLWNSKSLSLSRFFISMFNANSLTFPRFTCQRGRPSWPTKDSEIMAERMEELFVVWKMSLDSTRPRSLEKSGGNSSFDCVTPTSTRMIIYYHSRTEYNR